MKYMRTNGTSERRKMILIVTKAAMSSRWIQCDDIIFSFRLRSINCASVCTSARDLTVRKNVFRMWARRKHMRPTVIYLSCLRVDRNVSMFELSSFFFSSLYYFFLLRHRTVKGKERIDLDSLIRWVHWCRRAEDIEPTWGCHIIEFTGTGCRRKVSSNDRRRRWICIDWRIKRHLGPTWTWHSR